MDTVMWRTNLVNMKKEYENLISEHDKTLSYLRSEWLDSLTKDKDKWLEKINTALDERIRLMALRDKKPKKKLTPSKNTDNLGGS